MSPSSFLLRHFDRLAEAPGGIAKFRALVLQLAVQGKLVSQDSSEAPACALVTEIAKTRSKLVTEKKLRDSPPISPVAGGDQPFTIPRGWEWVRFGNITFCRDGERIPVSSEERKTRERVYDYYGASGVIDKIDGFLFDKPLLLIGEDGANLVNRSTPIAFIARGKYWVNNHAHVLDGISEEFLCYVALFINAIDLKPYVTGTAQPKMNQAKMNSIPVPLPPLAEQRRIVAKVAELMAQCDDLEAAQQEREVVRTRLRNSALHQLASPDSDSKSTAYVLQNFARLTSLPDDLEDIRHFIRQLAVQGQLLSQLKSEKHILDNNLCDVDPDLPAAPETWRWASVGDIGDQRLGKMLDHQKNRGIPKRYLRNINVRWFDFDLSNVLEMKFEDEELDGFGLKRGDVMICEGGYPGRAAVWDEREPNIYFQKAIHRVRFSNAVDPHFFVLRIRTDYDSGHLAGYFTGTGIQHFTGRGLASYTIPLPPLAEQRRIVAKVDELMAVLDALEATLTTARTTSERLLAALVDELTTA